MTTTDDLEWWLALAGQSDWIFAKTYAQTAPHEYVVTGRSPLSEEDFVRAAHVIHTFGEPGKYYNSTNIYLTSPDGRWKWWTMDRDLRDTRLINRATTDRVYGEQNAPRTYTGTFTEYDAIATEWDQLRDSSEDDRVRELIIRTFGDRPFSVLDVGCGTGALLDLGVVDPRRYTGVDPSQAMLNRLVRKHPRVGRVIPSRFEEADLADRYDLVVVMDVPGVDLERFEEAELVIGTGRSQ